MEKISIFNYEAFYLDFLEGNLNEEDSALLLTFLEEHPELILDDTSLPTIQFVENNLDSNFKENLKQNLSKKVLISDENVEDFLLMDLEGQLSLQEKTELKEFLSLNPTFEKDRKLYAATILKPNHKLIYGDKKSLKKRTVVLWPYISLAAAASVALLLYFGALNPSGNIPKQGIAKHKNSTIKKGVPSNKNSNENKSSGDTNTYNSNEENEVLENDPLNNTVNPELNQEENTNHLAVLPNKKRVDSYSTEWKKLPLKGVTRLMTKPNEFEVEDNKVALNTTPIQKEGAEDSYAMVGFEEMNNPIAPITNRIKGLVKQDVDFRTAKPTKKKSGGFYVKIGKFEISHRKF